MNSCFLARLFLAGLFLAAYLIVFVELEMGDFCFFRRLYWTISGKGWPERGLGNFQNGDLEGFPFILAGGSFLAWVAGLHMAFLAPSFRRVCMYARMFARMFAIGAWHRWTGLAWLDWAHGW